MSRKVLNKSEYSKLTNEINDYFAILEERITKLEKEKNELLEENKQLAGELEKLRKNKGFFAWIKGLFKKETSEDNVEKYNTNPLDTQKIREELDREIDDHQESEGLEETAVFTAAEEEEVSESSHGLYNNEVAELEDTGFKKPFNLSNPYKIESDTLESASMEFNKLIDEHKYEGFKMQFVKYLSKEENSKEDLLQTLEEIPLENSRVTEIILEMLHEDLIFEIIEKHPNIMNIIKGDIHNPKIMFKMLKIFFIHRSRLAEEDLKSLLYGVLTNYDLLNNTDRELLILIYVVLNDLKGPEGISEYLNDMTSTGKKYLMDYFRIYRDKSTARSFNRRSGEQYESLESNSLNNKVRKKVYAQLTNSASDIIISEKL